MTLEMVVEKYDLRGEPIQKVGEATSSAKRNEGIKAVKLEETTQMGALKENKKNPRM